MGKRLNIKKGDVINGCEYIKDLPPYIDNKSKKPKRMVLMICKCGNEFSTLLASLRVNRCSSCGCNRKESAKNLGKSNITHGDSRNKLSLFKQWDGIKARCYRPNSTGFKNYGGRGIKMYEPWINDYECFKNWVLNNLGERPNGHTFDRINNDGNYEPNNLRWSDWKIQNNNKRKIKT